MKAITLLVTVMLVISAQPALTLIETYDFSNPEWEVRYQNLTE